MRPRRKTSQRAARRSFANGGSSTGRSRTVWRKPAIGYSPSPNCHRANGGAPVPRTRSNGCMRSSNAGSRPRPSCPQQRLPPCCSGRCSPPVRSTCARSMAGRRSPQGPSISQLTSPLDSITSCRWRLRHIEFQQKARRHLTIWPVVAQAQNYPTRPVIMVVPFAAGGTFDVMGRIIAARMSEILGQQVVVENTTGAGGIIGVNRVINAPADGYTVLLGTVGTHAYNQWIYKKRRYDAINDFTPVTLFSEQPMVLEARKDLPANDLREFIALLKSNG